MGKYSINLVAEFSIIYDGKELKKHKHITKTTGSEKVKKHYLSSNQKNASTQTLGSAFLDTIRKIQKSKYESDVSVLCQFWLSFYVLSDFSSDILSLNVHFSEKKSFEPTIFQLANIKNITKYYWSLQLSTNIKSPKFGTNPWIRSKYSWHRRLVSFFFAAKSRKWM